MAAHPLRDPVAAKQIMAWVSDEPMIYDKLTPLEYLAFVAGLWGIDAAAAQRSAEDLLGSLGLEPHLHERCEGFSKGMRQKVALAGALALPGWAVLILLPRRWPLLNAVPALLLPLALSALYAVLILTSLGEAPGGFGSLAEVRALFSDDRVLLAGWVHYLAFDLAIGAWEVRVAMRRGLAFGWVVPCLAATFLVGPAGFLLYLLLRAVLGGRAPHQVSGSTTA